MQRKYEDILDFWFNDPQHRKHWFQKSDAFDTLIQQQFEGDLLKASEAEYQDWLTEPKGRLAFIILTDQFPRNIYRNSARAYDFSALALEATLKGIALKQDESLQTVYEKMFFYLPLEHEENADFQQKSVTLFESLRETTLPEESAALESAIDFAKQHQDIITRFGRFPHRNVVFNRTSTEEEVHFLREDNIL